MATIPYLSQGYDQLTGLRRGKKQRPRPPTSGSFTLLGGSTFPPGYVGGPGFVGGTPGSGQQQPGPITTPGYTPNYADLIQQALAPLQAQLGAEGSADAATRNAALIRGIGQERAADTRLARGAWPAPFRCDRGGVAGRTEGVRHRPVRRATVLDGLPQLSAAGIRGRGTAAAG